MKRNIAEIKRDLENRKNNDIIYKKDKLKKIFEEDPDLIEVLGKVSSKPLNKFKDENNPTTEELKLRQEIIEFNERTNHNQIVPYFKLNGIQKEVLNFIMFDIEDSDVSYNNNSIKIQTISVMCLVHEDDMETEYDIVRTDLLSYIVKDLLSWTNVFGKQVKCVNDYQDIIDSRYHCRTLKFESKVPNTNPGHMGVNNRYDTFIN